MAGCQAPAHIPQATPIAASIVSWDKLEGLRESCDVTVLVGKLLIFSSKNELASTFT